MQRTSNILILLLCLVPPQAAFAGHAGDKGFVQVSPGRRYFQWADGTRFLPIGQNDWPGAFDLRKRSVEELDAYFQNLNEHGVNVLRLLMDVGDGPDVVWVETQPGQFNPAFKAWMDTIVGLAEKHDVYLIIALYPNIVGGPFGNWRFYPYSKGAGGTLDEHHQMVTDPRALEYEKGRMRYFVDNWGASAHIFSWELFNEFWLPDKTRPNKENIEAHNRWMDQMGQYIKDYETARYGRYHLRSVSSMRSEFPEDIRGLEARDTNMFNTPHLDFASYHGYGRQLRGAQGVKTNLGILRGDRIESEKLILSVHETVGTMLERSPGRPLLCTEDFPFANPGAKSYRNPVNPIRRMFRDYPDDQRCDLFLAANWAFLMSGAAGTTMRYPQESFEDAILDTHRTLVDFAALVPWSRFEAQPAHERISTDCNDLIRMALSDGQVMIAWFYHNVPYASRGRIQPRVSILGIRNRVSRVTWVDGRSGRILGKDRVERPSPFHLEMPPFVGHVACLIQPAP